MAIACDPDGDEVVPDGWTKVARIYDCGIAMFPTMALTPVVSVPTPEGEHRD